MTFPKRLAKRILKIKLPDWKKVITYGRSEMQQGMTSKRNDKYVGKSK